MSEPTLSRSDTERLLRDLYEVIEVADNSASEPADFIRGMQFMFEMAAGKLAQQGLIEPKIDGSAPAATAPPARLRVG